MPNTQSLKYVKYKEGEGEKYGAEWGKMRIFVG